MHRFVLVLQYAPVVDDSYIQPLSFDFYGASVKRRDNIKKIVNIL